MSDYFFLFQRINDDDDDNDYDDDALYLCRVFNNP